MPVKTTSALGTGHHDTPYQDFSSAPDQSTSLAHSFTPSGSSSRHLLASNEMVTTPESSSQCLNEPPEMNPSYASPKRKREPDHPDISPSSTRLRTDLPSRPYTSNPSGTSSPRTTVTGQLQALDLHRDTASPNLIFGTALDPAMSEPDLAKAHALPDPYTFGSNPDVAPPRSDTTAPADPASTPFLPSTPHLHPLSPPARTISPFPTSDTSVSCPKSPPPSAPPSNELDPQDDGTGINGIGYRPTPAMAYARAQRRKQQVAEWKSREAREARQRRSERRRGEGLMGGGERMGEGVMVRRVRFVEG